MKRKTNQQIAALTNRTTFRVRFSEIDSMQIVWHGEYVRYFEDGREAFGKQYGLDYMSIYREGYMVPIVDLTCQFKQEEISSSFARFSNSSLALFSNSTESIIPARIGLSEIRPASCIRIPLR